MSLTRLYGRTGGHDHRERTSRDRPRDRLAVGIDDRALAAPQGSSRTVIGPPAADLPRRRSSRPARPRHFYSIVMMAIDLPERLTTRPACASARGRRRELGIGVEPVELETAVAHLAVGDRPSPPHLGSGLEDDPADDPGIPDGLAVRPDDPALTVAPRRRTTLTSWLSPPGFRSSEGVGVRVDPPAARLALADHPRADAWST